MCFTAVLFYSEICLAHPNLDFYLAPTTSRSIPTWFTAAQPSISRLVLEQVQDQQTRILPLPGFISDPSALEPDGVHFLSAPGMRYVMHLIDSARYLLRLFKENVSRVRPAIYFILVLHLFLDTSSAFASPIIDRYISHCIINNIKLQNTELISLF